MLNRTQKYHFYSNLNILPLTGYKPSFYALLNSSASFHDNTAFRLKNIISILIIILPLTGYKPSFYTAFALKNIISILIIILPSTGYNPSFYTLLNSSASFYDNTAFLCSPAACLLQTSPP